MKKNNLTKLCEEGFKNIRNCRKNCQNYHNNCDTYEQMLIFDEEKRNREMEKNSIVAEIQDVGGYLND